MASVHCVRCGKERDGLAKAPFPGELGAQILASVCDTCWQTWIAEQTKEMNEHRLSLINPEHRERLTSLMKSFLKLKS
jgi:Fe-S cluster biosynthesis and repair protein YggX